MFKRTAYIFLFILLGILLSFLVHAGIEIPVIKLLINDFETYGLGLSWQQWYVLHHIFSAVTLLLGVTLGYWQGMYWWKRIYDKTHARE